MSILQDMAGLLRIDYPDTYDPVLSRAKGSIDPNVLLFADF